MERVYTHSIQWWESSRKWYNVVIVITIVLIELNFFQANKFAFAEVGINSFEGLIFTLCYWMIGANIFYSLGFGFESVVNFYLKNPVTLLVRKLIYFSGMLFSIFWTIDCLA